MTKRKIKWLLTLFKNKKIMKAIIVKIKVLHLNHISNKIYIMIKVMNNKINWNNLKI